MLVDLRKVAPASREGRMTSVVLVTLLAVALFGLFVNAGKDVLMTFKGSPVIPPGVYSPPFQLGAGDTHTYYFNATFENGLQNDFDFVLEVPSGDADLMVEGPISDPSGFFPEEPTVQVS